MPERKVYRFKIDPTAKQEAALSRYAGARRFVFNWVLARRKETYEQTGKSISWSELSAELTELKNKPGFEWLKEIDSQLRGRAYREVKRLWSECKTCHGRRFAVKQESRRFQRWECQCLQRMLRHHLPFPRVGEITVGQDLLLAMLHATRKRSRSSCMKRTGRSEAAKWPPFFRSLPPLRRAFGRRLLQRWTPQPTSGQAGHRCRSCRGSSKWSPSPRRRGR